MISISAVADSIIFYPERTNINLGILTEITGESYDNERKALFDSGQVKSCLQH